MIESNQLQFDLGDTVLFGPWNPGEPEKVSHAPPEDVRLHLPGQRFPTPADDRRIIDIDATIRLVEAQVIPEHQWNLQMLDVHHWYWISEWYKGDTLFRTEHEKLFANLVELPVNKSLVPNDFHALLHEVTEVTMPPEPEVMAQRIHGWDLSDKLLAKLSELADTDEHVAGREQQIARNPGIVSRWNNLSDPEAKIIDPQTDMWVAEQLRRHFIPAQKYLTQLLKVAPDDRFVDPESMFELVETAKPTRKQLVAANQHWAKVLDLGRAARRGYTTKVPLFAKAAA